jgi:hypothetical protein
MGTLRKELQVAVVCSTLCLLVCAAAFGFIVGWEAAKAVLLGGAVILVPSVWIAKHVASVRGAQYATVVALVKLPLCGLGFALFLQGQRQFYWPCPLQLGWCSTLNGKRSRKKGLETVKYGS